jgi:hypothetical protein
MRRIGDQSERPVASFPIWTGNRQARGWGRAEGSGRAEGEGWQQKGSLTALPAPPGGPPHPVDQSLPRAGESPPAMGGKALHCELALNTLAMWMLNIMEGQVGWGRGGGVWWGGVG